MKSVDDYFAKLKMSDKQSSMEHEARAPMVGVFFINPITRSIFGEANCRWKESRSSG